MKDKRGTAHFTARCCRELSCGHSWVMTHEQIREAMSFGGVTCPRCYGMAFVEHVSVRPT